MTNKYDHIIWDWNGTLLNDVELCLSIINNILDRINLTRLSLKDYKDIFTFPVKNYYENAGIDFSKYSFEALGKEWIKEYEQRRFETSLFPNAKEVLNHIRQNNIEQSILSAYSMKNLIEIVRHFEVENFFNHLVGLDNIYAASKIDLGKELVKKLGLNNERILLIGDTIHDFEVSEEIGTDCLLIAGGHQSKERLLSCGAPVVNSLNYIYSFLFN